MKAIKIHTLASQTFIIFSMVSITAVAVLGWVRPQSVMDMVGVKLSNTDAISSIRGVYGGVGITLTILLAYFVWKKVEQGTLFLCLLWGSYALSRLTTWINDGPLGDFGTQWLIIETFLCGVGLLLVMLKPKLIKQQG